MTIEGISFLKKYWAHNLYFHLPTNFILLQICEQQHRFTANSMWYQLLTTVPIKLQLIELPVFHNTDFKAISSVCVCVRVRACVSVRARALISVAMKSLYSPRESNECSVKSFSPCRQTSLPSTSATPSLCSPDNQLSAQIQVQAQSHRGVGIPVLYISIAPKQIAAKPNQISSYIVTVSAKTCLFTLLCT